MWTFWWELPGTLGIEKLMAGLFIILHSYQNEQISAVLHVANIRLHLGAHRGELLKGKSWRARFSWGRRRQWVSCNLFSLGKNPVFSTHFSQVLSSMDSLILNRWLSTVHQAPLIFLNFHPTSRLPSSCPIINQVPFVQQVRSFPVPPSVPYPPHSTT